MWCIAEITPEYRQRMYRLLDLYAEVYNPDYPVICVDEKSQCQALERTLVTSKEGAGSTFRFTARFGAATAYLPRIASSSSDRPGRKAWPRPERCAAVPESHAATDRRRTLRPAD